MTKLATCCFLALAAANAALEWVTPPHHAVTIDERAGR
jgi:hypothetical protein